MADSFNSAYLATRRDRNKEEMDKLLAEADGIIAQQAPAAPAPKAPAAVPKKESSPGIAGETLKAVGGGLLDAGRNAINAIDDAATWLDNNFLDLRMGSSTFGQAGGRKAAGQEAHQEQLQVPALPEYMQNKTTAGKVGRSIVQFVAPFLGATKALQGLGMANMAVRGAAAGAATDFAAFDPHEARLSNLIMEFSNGDPAIGKEVFKYLAADPTDTRAEGRFKNTIEGLGIGIAAEGIIKGVKATRAHFAAKGQNPAEAVQAAGKAPAEDLTALAVDTSKAPDLSLANQVELLTGVRNGNLPKFKKRADVAQAVKADDTAKAAAAQPKGLELAEGALPGTRTEGNPDAFLKGSAAPEMKLQDPNAIPFEGTAKEAPSPSHPEAWKLVEEDPTPRKLFLDPEEGIVVAKEGAPHQLDLDLAVPAALKKAERSPEETKLLEGYKELQEKALGKTPEKAPAEPSSASKGASEGADLDERIAKAQARVSKLMDEGADTDTAQKVLDNLLKKKEDAFRDHSTKLSKRHADKLETTADPLVDALAKNNKAILKAIGKQQGGFVSPSMLANMVSMQAGAVTGYLSAEDDATFAERLSLAGIGSLAGLGIKVGASKVLKGHERAVLDNPDPVAASLAHSDVEHIAPLTEALAAKKPSPVIHMDAVKGIVQAAREGRLEEVSKGAMKDAINFARVDSDADVDMLFQAVQSTFQKELDKSAGGALRTHEMVQQNAELVGTGLKSLNERYQGLAHLDSQVLADRQLLQASGEKAREMIQKALASGDDFAVLAAEKQLKLHATIQAKVAGNRTEIARALSAMRIQASSADLALNEASALLESMGGKAAKMDYFKRLQEIPSDEGLNKAIRMGAMAKTRDALTEAVVMGKLWSPVTHAANLVGNTLAAVGGVAEKATASMIGKYVTRSADAIQTGEVKAQMFGMLGGIDDALGITAQGLEAARKAAGQALSLDLKGAKNTLLDNIEEFGDSYRAAALDAPVGRSTMDQTIDAGNGATFNAISAKAFNLDAEKPLGILVDALGTFNRIPGRALGASDELFWAVNYRGELRAQAYRTARQEGLEGDRLVSRITDLIENPSQEMRAVAVKAAQDGTFTTPLNGFGKDLQKWVDAANVGGVPVGRMILPFVRTPYNIMKYAAERTPLVSMATDAWKADMKAGGHRRDMALARVTLGGMLLGLGASLQSGMKLGDTEIQIVGGGEFNRSAEKLNGELPYSLKIGDQYYAFNRLDPLGMFLGLGADFKDISGHVDEQTMGDLVAASVLSLSRNISSKSYLSGIVELTSALSQASRGNTKALERYWNDQGASLLPANTLFNTVRKEDDPLAREVWSLMDAVKNKLPGYSKDLPPVRNVFGEPVEMVGGLGPDMVSPIRTSQAGTDPLASEIARLNIDLKQPSKTMATAQGAKGIELTPQQYDKLVQTAGELFKTELGKLIASDAYKALPERLGDDNYQDAKEKVITTLHGKAKLVATRVLLAEDPELHAKWMADKKNAGAALTGQPVLPF